MVSGPDSTDKRKFTRIAFSATVGLATSAGDWQTELMDISLKGMLLRRPANWNGDIGEPAVIILQLEGEETGIRIEATVAHLDDNRLGFTVRHIDLDSLAHLRRLIELNLGNDLQLHRELAAMVRPRLQ